MCTVYYWASYIIRFLETLRTNLYGTDAEYTESIATCGKYAFETSVILGFDAAGLPAGRPAGQTVVTVEAHRFRLRFFRVTRYQNFRHFKVSSHDSSLSISTSFF